MQTVQTIAIILAAGQGTRLGRGPKVLLTLDGQTLLEKNLSLFSTHKKIDAIVVVAPRMQLPRCRQLARHFEKISVVAGGETRLASLVAGLRRCRSDDLVLVHNVANPFVSKTEITQVIAAAGKHGAAGLGRPVASTIKRRRGSTVETLPRAELFSMETPQVVRADLLRAGIAIAAQKKIAVTDDIQLAELAGVAPRLIRAREENKKITTAADLPTAYRTGLGQDSHRFQHAGKRGRVTSPTKPLMLGGVQIAKTGGLSGNSDADVILHALCNALSSAIGGGSLSTWTDDLCKKKGVTDSRVYLAAIVEKVQKKGWHIAHCAVAIEAGKPKLEKHLPTINRSLAKLLGVSTDCVGCTVTSGEGLTACGRGEGVQAFCLVLLCTTAARV